MEHVPDEVLRVIRDPSAKKHHKAMSRKGGIESAKKRREVKEDRELEEESRIMDASKQQAQQYSVSEGDVLPPGQEELTFLEQQND